jgi:hypothetical protein
MLLDLRNNEKRKGELTSRHRLEPSPRREDRVNGNSK